MELPFEVAQDVYVLPSWFEVPGLGLLAINAFLLAGREPILVDTGLTPECDAFVAALTGLIDPADLRWIYLTHDDSDHIGALHALLELAPRATVITTFLGAGKMSLFRPLPIQRVYFLNPGESLQLGDRLITALRPPLFDSPASTAMYEHGSRLLFSCDFFGAVLAAPVRLASELPAAVLAEAQILWANVDVPWVQTVDRARYRAAIAEVARLDPAWILSSHLPPARGVGERFCATLARAPDAEPWVGPDQAALLRMLSAPPPQ
jgi:flavorubredoxin